jgi:Zn finger protein HypA/HybF involved in hydrogenase expression
MEHHETDVFSQVKNTLRLIEDSIEKIKQANILDIELKLGQLQSFKATIEKSVKTYTDATVNKESFYRYNVFLTNPPQSSEELRAQVVNDDHKNDETCCTCKSSVALKKKHTCRFCSSTTCNNSKCFATLAFNEINTNVRYKSITYRVLVCKVCEESIKKGWPQSLKMIDNIEEYVIGVKESINKIMTSVELSK